MNAKILYITAIIFTCLVGGSQSAELKHLWDFEGDEWWLDKVGEAHGDTPAETSTLEIDSGAAGVGSSMKVGVEIGSADDFLALDSGELYAPGTEAFSFFYWIRMPDDNSSDPRGIFDFSGNGLDGVQSLFIGTTDELAFRIDLPGAGNVLVKVPMNLEDGEWHSVAATYDPTEGLEVHVDGFGVDGSAAAVPGSVAMSSDAWIGTFNFNGGISNKGIAGSIDDLAIYSGVLSEEEITELSVRTKPDIRIDTVALEGEALTITWAAPEGELFSVWSSVDLSAWEEENDNVEAGMDGASFTLQLDDPNPRRMYLQVRRPEE